MLKFLELITSTSGYVGRAVWWWTQLASLVLAAVLCVSIIYTSERISHLSSVPEAAHDAYLRSLPIPERNREKAEMLAEDWNIIYPLTAGLLLLFWAHLAIEIKRWHDLELSEFCVLLRFIPAVAHAHLGVVLATVTSFAVGAGMLYFLGFRAGIYAHSGGIQQPTRSRAAILYDAVRVFGVIVGVIALVRYILLSNPDITVVPPSWLQMESALHGGN